MSTDTNNATERADAEGQRTITVRMPRSLQQLLRAEAYRRETSMNRLCIELLQWGVEAGMEQRSDAADHS